MPRGVACTPGASSAATRWGIAGWEELGYPSDMKRAAALLSLVGICLLACKLGDNKPAGHCDARASEGFCFEYPKGEVEAGKSVCVNFKGTWSDGACDRSAAHGVCKLSSGINKVFYPSSQFASVDDAKKLCFDKWVGPDEK